MSKNPEAASLCMRVGSGLAFLVSGMGHLWAGVEGGERFGLHRVVHAFGLTPAHGWIVGLGVAEAILGLFLLVGLLTRVVVWPLVLLIMFTLFTGRWSEMISRPHSTIDQLVYLGVLLGIFFCGAGACSMDKALIRRRAREAEDRA